MSRYDILNLEWGTKMRDSNITTPVLIYLREEKKYTVKSSSIAYAVLKLVIYRPKMLLMANSIGSPEQTRVFRYAYLLGIKTVSLISEGDIPDDPALVEEFFWGWNFKKKCYLDLLLLWSERSKKLFEEYVPESREFNIKVSGATGFDRYKLLKNVFMTKEALCAKYQKHYEKVVGIASFAFTDYFAVLKDGERKEFYRKSCIELRKILKDTIQYFSDILFVLRLHPMERSNQHEFLGLESLENVIIIKSKDQPVSDNINACDIWMAYASTTCMEAWLLDKPTLLINPFPIEFDWFIAHKGSPIMQNASDVISHIEEFYQNGKIDAFERLESARKEIINSVIEHADGKNYIRAAREVDKIMRGKINRKKRITIGFLCELMKDIIKWVWMHSIFKRIKDLSADGASYYYNYKQEECEEEAQMYYNAMYGNVKSK